MSSWQTPASCNLEGSAKYSHVLQSRGQRDIHASAFQELLGAFKIRGLRQECSIRVVPGVRHEKCFFSIYNRNLAKIAKLPGSKMQLHGIEERERVHARHASHECRMVV